MNRTPNGLAPPVTDAPVLTHTTLKTTQSVALRMRGLRRSISPIFCVLFVVLTGTSSLANAGSKVEVCHLPPDNIDNWHTIKIPENALEEHLNHGDLIGSCGSLAEDLCDDGNACTQDEFTQDENVCKAVEDRSPVDCDDGDDTTLDSCNPSTGCVNTITTCNVAGGSCRIFRTATEWQYDSFGGLAGADAKCQASADAASLGGTFKAWLSTSTTNAADRLVHAAVPYTRVDGTLIASDWGDLTDGALFASILTTEYDQPVLIAFPAYGRAWTGTNETGVVQTGCGGGGCTCNDWQTESNQVHTNPGEPQRTDSFWTGINGGSVWCQKLIFQGGPGLGLYCVEQ